MKEGLDRQWQGESNISLGMIVHHSNYHLSMILDASKVNSALIRVVTINGNEKFFTLSKATYSLFVRWAENLIKHMVFDAFNEGQLTIGDKAHNASIDYK